MLNKYESRRGRVFRGPVDIIEYYGNTYYQCPSCKTFLVSNQEFGEFNCRVTCDNCTVEFIGVDDLERCGDCVSRIDCLTNVVTTSISGSEIIMRHARGF